LCEILFLVAAETQKKNVFYKAAAMEYMKINCGGVIKYFIS
jgi:hypothetical protein